MTIRQLPDRTFAVNCVDCGQQYADEESGDYLFTSLVRMGLLMGADGWRADPVLCPACQPAGLAGEPQP